MLILRPVRVSAGRALFLALFNQVIASNGGAVRVSEAQIRDATLELARIGLYTEPTCAQAFITAHYYGSFSLIITDHRSL